MSTFDETQHPRGTGGRFTEKHHSEAAEVSLDEPGDAPSDVVRIRSLLEELDYDADIDPKMLAVILGADESETVHAETIEAHRLAEFVANHPPPQVPVGSVVAFTRVDNPIIFEDPEHEWNEVNQASQKMVYEGPVQYWGHLGNVEWFMHQPEGSETLLFAASGSLSEVDTSLLDADAAETIQTAARIDPDRKVMFNTAGNASSFVSVELTATEMRAIEADFGTVLADSRYTTTEVVEGWSRGDIGRFDSRDVQEVESCIATNDSLTSARAALTAARTLRESMSESHRRLVDRIGSTGYYQERYEQMLGDWSGPALGAIPPRAGN